MVVATGGAYTLAQPLMMEVSLVSAPGQQASTAPPAPPKAVEPIQPLKPLVKKPLKKKKLAKQKQAKLPKPETVSDAMLPAPSLTESFADASETNSDAAKGINAAKSASGTQGNAEPYSEASFNANYGFNPKPKYPTIARSKDSYYNRRFYNRFWDVPDLAAAKTLPAHVSRGPQARLASKGYAWLDGRQQSSGQHLKYRGAPAEILEQTLLMHMQKALRAMESGLTMLASIGSTAPFVGLFGTVVLCILPSRPIARLRNNHGF